MTRSRSRGSIAPPPSSTAAPCTPLHAYSSAAGARHCQQPRRIKLIQRPGQDVVRRGVLGHVQLGRARPERDREQSWLFEREPDVLAAAGTEALRRLACSGPAHGPRPWPRASARSGTGAPAIRRPRAALRGSGNGGRPHSVTHRSGGRPRGARRRRRRRARRARSPQRPARFEGRRGGRAEEVRRLSSARC